MRYFIDTEFIEGGPQNSIDLISIGVVAEDGREYYAEMADVPWWRANKFVKDHVRPLLGKVRPKKRFEIGADLVSMIGLPHSIGSAPEFWGYFGAYDWIVFCQIFGTMSDMPEGWPFFCMELKQLQAQMGYPALPAHPGPEHHALEDARWHRDIYRSLVGKADGQ